MTDQQKLRFVTVLANELDSRSIRLPSFPDVVLRIRDLLERENCDFDQVSNVVSSDPVLVSKLFVFANSAYHNRGGDKIENLEVAIARLGLQVVRNTAVSLAIKQLMLAQEFAGIAKYLRKIWIRSMKLSSMSFAVAAKVKGLNQDTAFLCGLLNDVGKVYILTKSKDFPEFLGNPDTINNVLQEWHPQVGRCVVQSWGFAEEIADSVDTMRFLDERAHISPTMSDIVYVAGLLLKRNECETLETSGEDNLDYDAIPACRKLQVSNENAVDILAGYQLKQQSVQQSLAG